MDTVCVTKADVSAQVDILERTVKDSRILACILLFSTVARMVCVWMDLAAVRIHILGTGVDKHQIDASSRRVLTVAPVVSAMEGVVSALAGTQAIVAKQSRMRACTQWQLIVGSMARATHPRAPANAKAAGQGSFVPSTQMCAVKSIVARMAFVSSRQDLMHAQVAPA